MGRRKLNLAGLAPRVLAANAGSGSGAAVSITGSGGGPPPGRGALHASQWRALATLFNVHFEQAQGMCWPCFFAASCALNVIVIAVRRVPRASERDFRELGLDHTLRARNFPSDASQVRLFAKRAPILCNACQLELIASEL